MILYLCLLQCQHPTVIYHDTILVFVTVPTSYCYLPLYYTCVCYSANALQLSNMMMLYFCLLQSQHPTVIYLDTILVFVTVPTSYIYLPCYYTCVCYSADILQLSTMILYLCLLQCQHPTVIYHDTILVFVTVPTSYSYLL